jgi:hypothetical protein
VKDADILIGAFQRGGLADFGVKHEEVMLVDIDLDTRVASVKLQKCLRAMLFTIRGFDGVRVHMHALAVLVLML